MEKSGKWTRLPPRGKAAKAKVDEDETPVEETTKKEKKTKKGLRSILKRNKD